MDARQRATRQRLRAVIMQRKCDRNMELLVKMAQEEERADAVQHASVSMRGAMNSAAPSQVKVFAGGSVTWEIPPDSDLCHEIGVLEIVAGKKTIQKASSPPLGPGDKFTFTFDAVGSFDFYCKNYPFIEGKVVAVEPASRVGKGDEEMEKEGEEDADVENRPPSKNIVPHEKKRSPKNGGKNKKVKQKKRRASQHGDKRSKIKAEPEAVDAPPEPCVAKSGVFDCLTACAFLKSRWDQTIAKQAA